MSCACVFIMLVSLSMTSDLQGLPPLPRRSPGIYSKTRSRVWFEEIFMDNNKFDYARYKYFFRMSRETVAYIVQAL